VRARVGRSAVSDDDVARTLRRLQLLIELRTILDDARPSAEITAQHLDALNQGPLWQREQLGIIYSEPNRWIVPPIE
jgi:hypothetical protein